ncbi:penicillin acylase family protein [Enhygromyxa salina]|uniref:penicillin acylase family protein n=1 Tax=Enhygromyxa salina TaxID=215803 RepID=UPI0015E6EF1A|nr:penicillin acylase family protein [Enhygromyxa salina]
MLLPPLLGSCGPAEGDPGPEPGVVDVYVDAQGVAHVYAPTDASLFWASGYLQAEARLAQMVLLRRRALGRQAEVLGVGKVDEDELSRIMNFRDLGARDIERVREQHPDDYALYEAWVAGVNAYIEELASDERDRPVGLGPEGLDLIPEPWTVADVGAIAKLLMFGNSNSLENELLTTVLLRIDPTLFDALELPLPAYPIFTLPPEHRPAPGAALPLGLGNLALPPAPDVDPRPTIAGLKRLHETLAEFSVEGSNAWAVAGAHTATGGPLLANDPHQPMSSPSIVYATHLDSKSAGGNYAVAGFAFAGSPGVQLGHTQSVAWGATTGTADVMDLWSVSVNADAQTVQVGDASVAYVPRTETIGVRGQSDVVLVVDEVPGYGLLLGDALLLDLGIDEAFVAGADRRLLLNWTGFTAGNELPAFMAMSRSTSVDEFQAAADMMEVGTFNWLFADAQSIAYRSRILVPDRGSPSAMAIPFSMLDGADASSYWSGAYLADALLPASRDPAQGYLLSSNNDPYGFTEDGDVRNDPFYFGTFFLPGFRAQRGDDELRRLIADGSVDVAAMQALQTDNHLTEADMLLPVVSAAWAAVASDPDLAQYEGRADIESLVTQLEGWDRRMAADSGPAIGFFVFANELARVTVGDEMSLVFEAVVGAAPAFPLKFSALTITEAYANASVLLDGTPEALALAALDATAVWLADRYGSVDMSGLRWDAIHKTRFESPIDALTWGDVGTAGSVGSLNQLTGRYFDANGDVAPEFISKHGPMFRSVVAFGPEGPRMHYNFAPGNGGSPNADFWGDLVDAWVAGTYVEMPFAREDVEAAAVETRRLTAPEPFQ